MLLHFSLLRIGTETCLPALRNMLLHFSLLRIGTETCCRMDGRTPPSLSLPHPATVPNSPISRSSLPGRQIGIMLSANVTLLSARTRARSFSYVKKLYFGWTTFLAAFSSKCWFGSLAEEKSHSPILTRICEIIKSSTQWPAVATQYSLTSAPPHL